MLTIKYAGEKVDDVAKLWLETQAAGPPPNVRLIGPYDTFGGEGIKSYMIYEVEKGYEDEVLTEVNKRLVRLCRNPEYKINTEILTPAAVALALLES